MKLFIFCEYGRTSLIKVLSVLCSVPELSLREHRVFFKRSATTEVQVDSIITAVRSTQEGVPPKLIMASRCALPPAGCLEGDGQLRFFPARPQQC